MRALSQIVRDSLFRPEGQATSFNRKDFGLGWNSVLEAGGVVVGEKVEITLEIEAIQAAVAAAA